LLKREDSQLLEQIFLKDRHLGSAVTDFCFHVGTSRKSKKKRAGCKWELSGKGSGGELLYYLSASE
jgi:hypothetical protein